MTQLDLQYTPPITLDVDGKWDRKNNIRYIGDAYKQLDGTWRCLADVGGALCLVEMKVTITDSWEK